MNKIKTILAVLVLAIIVSSLQVSSQWEPPSASGPDNNVPAPIHIGSESQIKKSALGINLSNTLHPITSGAALDIYDGSLFVRPKTTPSNWTASPDFAIDTAGPIASHGVLSTGNIHTTKSLVSTDLSGSSVSRSVCADSAGRLVICPTSGPVGPIGPGNQLDLVLLSEAVQTEIALAEIVPCGSNGSSDITTGDPRYCYKFNAPDQPFVVQYDVANATYCSGTIGHVAGPKRTFSLYPLVLDSKGSDAKSATLTVEDTPTSRAISQVSEYDYVLTCGDAVNSKSVTSRVRVFWSTKQ